MRMSLYNDIEMLYKCWQERSRTIYLTVSKSYSGDFNWAEYNIKQSVLCSDLRIESYFSAFHWGMKCRENYI